MLCSDGQNYFVFDNERLFEFCIQVLEKGPIVSLMTVFPDDCLRLEKAYKVENEPWDMGVFIIGMLIGAYHELLPKNEKGGADLVEYTNGSFLMSAINRLVEDSEESLKNSKNKFEEKCRTPEQEIGKLLNISCLFCNGYVGPKDKMHITNEGDIRRICQTCLNRAKKKEIL